MFNSVLYRCSFVLLAICGLRSLVNENVICTICVYNWNVFFDTCLAVTESVLYLLQALWQSRLLRYFQNARSRRDKCVDIVIRHKRPSVKRATLPSKSVGLFGIANYLPQRASGDTDDTISDMMKVMCDESRRLKPNLGRIDHLMNQTFPDRRKVIACTGIDTLALKEKFPCLFTLEQVQ